MPSPWQASPLVLVLGGVMVAIVAFAAALTPMLSRFTGQRRIRTGLWLGAAAAFVGLAVYVACASIGQWWIGGGLGLVAGCLAALAVIDARWLLIPDLHVVLLMVLALVGPLASGPLAALGGAVLGAGLLWGVRALFLRLRGIEAMGLGDVKLMAALGALVGPLPVLWVIVAACALGIVWGLVRSRGRIGQAPPAPFGAMAALPALAVLAWLKLAPPA